MLVENKSGTNDLIRCYAIKLISDFLNKTFTKVEASIKSSAWLLKGNVL